MEKVQEFVRVLEAVMQNSVYRREVAVDERRNHTKVINEKQLVPYAICR